MLRSDWLSYYEVFSGDFWIAFFAGAGNKKVVDNFNFRTKDFSTDRFTVKEDSGRGITTISEARILQNATTFEPLFTTDIFCGPSASLLTGCLDDRLNGNPLPESKQWHF